MGNFRSFILPLGLLAGLAACSPSGVMPQPSETKIVDESLSQLDLMRPGSFQTVEFDYDSGPLNDSDVLPGGGLFRVKSDIRGRIYMPKGDGPFPLVVLLHGNHATCGVQTGEGNPRLDVKVDFTTSGRCPGGYIESPSYRGYDETARLLASHGYLVSSINANRGITGRNGDSSDGGLIYARGNLVLRHIEELNNWSRTGSSALLETAETPSLSGKLDISRVGLMGHSRGGEGVRYAYNIYNNGTTSAKWKGRIPGLTVKGIFEIGPVDMGTDKGKTKMEASGVAWNVLIPGCDRDVLDFSGVNPYERMLANINDGLPKSVFTVWGANHNYFNAEWQVSDAPHRCNGSQRPLWDVNADPMPSAWENVDPTARAGLTGSDAQIDISKALMLAFFDSHLGNGAAQKLDHVFDPQYRLPSQISRLADTSREYYVANDSKSVFDAETFVNTATAVEGLSVTTLKDHVADNIKLMTKALTPFGYKASLYSGAVIRNAAVIEGEKAPGARSVFLPLNQASSGKGYWTLDIGFAARKACFTLNDDLEPVCSPQDLDNTFKVALVLEDGTVTPSVAVNDYVELENWYSDYFSAVNSQSSTITYVYIPVLYQTTRFELSDFKVTDQTIKGVQLTFNSGKSVALVVDSMRLTKKP
jgi:dienelactone hydrolase